jgi:dsRNA-specific ribonuclease
MLSTLHARLGLSKAFSLDTLSRCLTCKTPTTPSGHNRSLAELGHALMLHQVARHTLRKHPRLPEAVIRSTEKAYVGSAGLKAIGKGWGVEVASGEAAPSQGRLVYQQKVADTEDAKGLSEASAYAAVVRAVVGGIVVHDGEEAARAFIKRHVLSREVNIAQTFKVLEPQRQLSVLCRREGLEAPVNRLIAETGRLTNSPVFVVGVYSGAEKLGEGQAASLKEAEFLVWQFFAFLTLQANIQAQTAALKGWMMFADPRSEGDSPAIIDSGDIIV